MSIHHFDTSYIVHNIVQSTRRMQLAPIDQTITWSNWIGNNEFKPGVKDALYYKSPTKFSELKYILEQAFEQGKKIRVSGQRHSAAPLIISNNSGQDKVESGSTWVIDLSCYSDLGKQGTSNIVLNKKTATVTVNAGVSETELDAFLTKHGYRLKTTTAGGFFSMGGITAVDAHGAAVNQSIFSDSAIAYTVVNDYGVKTTYDSSSEKFSGYSPLQFFRTSLGSLGVVTSITLRVAPRPSKESVLPSHKLYSIVDEQDFQKTYADLLFSGTYDSIESFFNPYAKKNNFLAFRWQIKPAVANAAPGESGHTNKSIVAHVTTTCRKAVEKMWGATLFPDEKRVEKLSMKVQNSKLPFSGNLMISTSFSGMSKLMDKAIAGHDLLWLSHGLRSMDMSYFIPLPQDSAEKALHKAWKALQIVRDELSSSRDFISPFPVEFRFVRGSNSLLAGNYTEHYSPAVEKNQLFLVVEVVGAVRKGSVEDYPVNLVNYFSRVERKWVAMGGMPHNAKMYGFYDPENPETDTGTAPFNPGFIRHIWSGKRLSRVEAFAAYQKKLDPGGMFCGSYGRLLGICK